MAYFLPVISGVDGASPPPEGGCCDVILLGVVDDVATAVEICGCVVAVLLSILLLAVAVVAAAVATVGSLLLTAVAILKIRETYQLSYSFLLLLKKFNIKLAISYYHFYFKTS